MAQQAKAAVKQAQVVGFPKEFNHHFADSFDVTYWVTFAVNFIIFFGLFGYLQTLEPKPMSAEDLKKYMQAIYRVEQTPPVQETAQSTEAAGMEEQGEEVEAPDAEVLREERAAAAQQRMQAAAAAAQERMARARAAAQEHAIFAAAAGASRRGTGGARGHAARRLSGGGAGGVDMGGLRGVATSDRAIDAVQTARSGGALTEGSGGPGGGELSIEEIERILGSSTVELDAPPEITAPGGGTASRSSSDIRAVVNRESNALKVCYNNQKRQDPRLTGKITIDYLIRSNGSVGNVRIKNTQWSNAGLGRRVESCVRQRVSRWRFPPAEGDTQTSFSLNFI